MHQFFAWNIWTCVLIVHIIFPRRKHHNIKAYYKTLHCRTNIQWIFVKCELYFPTSITSIKRHFNFTFLYSKSINNDTLLNAFTLNWKLNYNIKNINKTKQFLFYLYTTYTDFLHSFNLLKKKILKKKFFFIKFTIRKLSSKKEKKTNCMTIKIYCYGVKQNLFLNCFNFLLASRVNDCLKFTLNNCTYYSKTMLFFSIKTRWKLGGTKWQN